MNNRLLRPAALLCGALLAAFGAAAQNPPSQSASPYGGNVVEDIVARVNDQIITQSDYDRAMQQLDEEGRQHGESMQEMSEAHRDLLRNLIDQQLWLSKGKELGVTGDTELIKRLDEIRKQYNMASLEDLENAAKEQGVSWEDFQQNIRNQIITQEVMRQEVGEKIQFTPGEAMQYYDQHKQDYQQPESVRLSEILIPATDDPAKIADAKAKAEDVEAKLKAGGDFAELARTNSEGPTAAQGGDLGQFRHGGLAKVFEDKVFDLQAGQWTDPIQTRQGWAIFKVTQHTPPGAQPYKDVQDQVEEALYMSRMEPAIRDYLTKMREEAFIDIKSGYADTGASPNETKPVFSAYVPPAPKKKAKVERARYRESTHGFRQKSTVISDEAPANQTPTTQDATAKNKTKGVAEKPGKKEKIRYGQAPRETLPTAASAGSNTENAGALPETAAANEPANPLEPTAPTQKTRFSARARTETKTKKSATAQNSSQTPSAPDAAEVADRQTQAAPLGLGSSTTANKKKQKKAQTTTGEKTRMSQEAKKPSEPKQAPQITPAPQEPGAPAPADHPTTQPAPQQQ
jgi:peptidyl-prolyl cis-trans isomerase SurA